MCADAPGRLPAGATYEPLLWVGDWYKTLLAAAIHSADEPSRTAAEQALAPTKYVTKKGSRVSQMGESASCVHEKGVGRAG